MSRRKISEARTNESNQPKVHNHDEIKRILNKVKSSYQKIECGLVNKESLFNTKVGGTHMERNGVIDKVLSSSPPSYNNIIYNLSVLGKTKNNRESSRKKNDAHIGYRQPKYIRKDEVPHVFNHKKEDKAFKLTDNYNLDLSELEDNVSYDDLKNIHNQEVNNTGQVVNTGHITNCQNYLTSKGNVEPKHTCIVTQQYQTSKGDLLTAPMTISPHRRLTSKTDMEPKFTIGSYSINNNFLTTKGDIKRKYRNSPNKDSGPISLKFSKDSKKKIEEEFNGTENEIKEENPLDRDNYTNKGENAKEEDNQTKLKEKEEIIKSNSSKNMLNRNNSSRTFHPVKHEFILEKPNNNQMYDFGYKNYIKHIIKKESESNHKTKISTQMKPSYQSNNSVRNHGLGWKFSTAEKICEWKYKTNQQQTLKSSRSTPKLNLLLSNPLLR